MSYMSTSSCLMLHSPLHRLVGAFLLLLPPSPWPLSYNLHLLINHDPMIIWVHTYENKAEFKTRTLRNQC
eukprot:9454207-Heterocapsa_arctica.AAC.1